MLYDTNIELIKLLGYSKLEFEDVEKIEDLFISLAQNICWLIPTKTDFEKKQIKIMKDDGILDFKDEIHFIAEDYHKLFNDNKEILFDIKYIRNKAEHKRHIIKVKMIGSGTVPESLNIIVKIEDKTYDLKVKDYISLIIGLNTIFDKMIEEIVEIAKESNEMDHPFVRKHTRFKFSQFTYIINSDVIIQVGRIMKFQ